MRLVCIVASVAGFATGCLDNPGRDPVPEEFAFPAVLALSPATGGAAEQLFVLNTNFDLRYNAGQVQSLDLECLNQVADDCGEDFEDCDFDCDLFDGEVFIGSYGSDLAVDPSGDRLYVTVRSDNDLTTIEVDEEGSLDCGSGASQTCAREFTRVDQDEASARDISLPEDPVSVHIGRLADLDPNTSPTSDDAYLIAGHRDGGASLLLTNPSGVPRLVHSLTGLPAELTGISFQPSTRLAWVTTAIDPEIARIGVAVDSEIQTLEYSYLYNAGSLAVAEVGDEGLSIVNSRVTRFDPRPGSTFAYILTRRLESVLVVDTSLLGGDDVLPTIDSIQVGPGPSRLEIAEFEGRMLGFVTCHDARDLEVLDLDRRQPLGLVKGLTGPFELEIDEVRQRIYIADFAASVIRVVSLEPMIDCLAGTASVGEECVPIVVGTIGAPRGNEGLN